jgi:hypothetical protein
MPAISEARIRANQQNAQRSSGPKTPEGKAVSRRNGLKHGLTGQGIVLAEADVSEVDVRASALMTELAPKSTLGAILVGQMATLSVRMERGAKREEEALATRVRHAGETFDHDRIDLAEAIYGILGEDPRAGLIDLKRLPEGVDRLIEAWADLREVLTRFVLPHQWEGSHQSTLGLLLGLRPDPMRRTRADQLSLAVRNMGNLADPEWIALESKARQMYARDRLVERIDEEIAKLEAHRLTFNFEAIELDRQGAADLALFDTSREAILARRYESEARRGFFKALEQLRKVEAEAANQPATEPNPEPVAQPLGSSCGETSSTPREPSMATRDGFEWSIAPTDGIARGLDGRMIAAGRTVVAPG